ncbi:MAG: hypothetical protein JXK93_03315 [Sphaerochaetaceae bacterium]|nr:hypothetical protein [Sphaerochaetaceae bacterium]
MKKMLVIHHSHTDIGYTEPQERIELYHATFITQVIRILDDLHAGRLAGCEGFKWQCENHWQVENFYSCATEEQKRSFENYIRSGEIGLSGNYLNMTELIDADILDSRIAKAAAYAERIAYPIQSGMSADVNGYAWGYVDALHDNGVVNMYCALHSHHGMFPLSMKQTPFYWKGPKGNSILMWSGEHYHFGNELFLAPFAGTSYMIYDEIRDMAHHGPLIGTGGRIEGFCSVEAQRAAQEKLELEFAQIRIRRYVENLENEGYPFDFIPVLVSGCITDNAPPQALIAGRIRDLNQLFEGELEISMVTLDHFFHAVRNSSVEIPTYSGDWTDWWADGVASTPLATKVCREAQRKYSLCRKLDSERERGDAALVEAAAEYVMLFCEHTWGYTSSVVEPWNSLVASLEKKKDAYAANAHTAISKNLDTILKTFGEKPIEASRKQIYRAINPHSVPVRMPIKVYVRFWENIDGMPVDLAAIIEAYTVEGDELLPSQSHSVIRAIELEVMLDLQPGEAKDFYIRQGYRKGGTALNHAFKGADGVEDVVKGSRYCVSPCMVETDTFKVLFDQETGISSIYDKVHDHELVASGSAGAFSGIHEITPMGRNPKEVRKAMGRNRSSIATRRSVSRLSDVEILDNGGLYVHVKISYELAGCRFYSLYLKIYRHISYIDVRVVVHKETTWEPENLYVALPFVTDGDNETYVEKTGCFIRPGIDQLPGTCQDFYVIQSGLYRKGKRFDVLIGTKDAPLLSFGERGVKPVELCDCSNTALNRSTPYSWVMNNFWEVNFKADLGGFHEFRYSLFVGKQEDVSAAFAILNTINEELLGFNI